MFPVQVTPAGICGGAGVCANAVQPIRRDNKMLRDMNGSISLLPCLKHEQNRLELSPSGLNKLWKDAGVSCANRDRSRRAVRCEEETAWAGWGTSSSQAGERSLCRQGKKGGAIRSPPGGPGSCACSNSWTDRQFEGTNFPQGEDAGCGV